MRLMGMTFQELYRGPHRYDKSGTTHIGTTLENNLRTTQMNNKLGTTHIGD